MANGDDRPPSRDFARGVAYRPTLMSGPCVILGGGVAGLAAARLVTRHFPRVIVLERDVRPAVSDPEEAFGSWQRSGVPQFRHSHAFLARLRLVLLGHMPDVLDRLRGAGVREITLAETAPPGMAFGARMDDEDVVLLACRRATFEWALRESAAAQGNVELREDVQVTGLVATRRDEDRPQITGVRLADGTIVPAGLVIDASGRRSKAPDWLHAIGAGIVRERSQETGIFYYTRFYRLRGDTPPQGVTGLVAGDLGWVKLAVFPGDARTFSITVGAPVDDPALKGLHATQQFERFVRAFPSTAPWRQPGVADPIHGDETPVLCMGELRNRLRHFVDDDGPLARGFLAIGDAAYHTNPIYGRGCTMALVQASILAEALSRYGHDYAAVANHLHRESEHELRPFWEVAVAGDRRALGHVVPALTDSRALVMWAAGQAFGWFLERGLLPATRVDPVVFRGLLRTFHMLEAPENLFADPGLLLRSLPVLARVLRGDAPKEMFERVTRARVVEQLQRSA